MADSPVHGNEFGLELCEALGLDPNRVIDIDIHVDPHSAAHVSVGLLLERAEVDALVRIVTQSYKLIEVSDG